MTEFNLLVVGSGRGGTTLLASVLDAHPDIVVASELNARKYLMEDPERLFTGGRVFCEKCQEEAQKYTECRWGNKILTLNIRGLVDSYDFEKKKWIYGAETRQNIEMLDRFFNIHLKGVQVIFIIRDGRSCVSSMMRRSKSLEAACLEWKYTIQVATFLATRPESLIIRFENLVLEPEQICKQMCTFLDVPYNSEMLKGAINPKGYYIENGFNTAKVLPPDLPEIGLKMIQNELQLCGYQ